MKKLPYLPIIASLTAYLALLPINKSLAPLLQFRFSGRESINRMATAQLLTLVLVCLFCLLIRKLNPEGFKKYWRPGNGSAPAQAVKILGIKEGESWRSVGIGFSVAITALTFAFMWMGVYQKTPIDWLQVLPWVLLFSASNAFSEEMIGRFGLAAGLDGLASKATICWWSAAIFGSVHYFGTPGGLIGVFMAGFLAWLLAKSVVETRGIGWAWFIHFLQDVVILFAMLGQTG